MASNKKTRLAAAAVVAATLATTPAFPAPASAQVRAPAPNRPPVSQDSGGSSTADATAIRQNGPTRSSGTLAVSGTYSFAAQQAKELFRQQVKTAKQQHKASLRDIRAMVQTSTSAEYAAFAEAKGELVTARKTGDAEAIEVARVNVHQAAKALKDATDEAQTLALRARRQAQREFDEAVKAAQREYRQTLASESQAPSPSAFDFTDGTLNDNDLESLLSNQESADIEQLGLDLVDAIDASLGGL